MDHIKKHLKYVMLVVLSFAVPFVAAAKVKDDARNAKNAKTEKSRSKSCQGEGGPGCRRFPSVAWVRDRIAGKRKEFVFERSARQVRDSCLVKVRRRFAVSV